MSAAHPDLTMHAESVWRIACRLLDDTDDARECYQQTFADALKVDPNVVKNWRAVLSSIATRRAIDLLRQRYRARSRYQPLDSDPASDNPPEADLSFRELRQAVRETLAALPANQAEAFWLRHLELLDNDEIAEQLGVESGHVRVLVHRALMHVRKSLGPTYGAAFAAGEET